MMQQLGVGCHQNVSDKGNRLSMGELGAREVSDSQHLDCSKCPNFGVALIDDLNFRCELEYNRTRPPRRP